MQVRLLLADAFCIYKFTNRDTPFMVCHFTAYLIFRVLQLIRLTDQRLPSRGAEKLELAYLWFLEQFRKIYISDQVQKTTKVIESLVVELIIGFPL